MTEIDSLSAAIVEAIRQKKGKDIAVVDLRGIEYAATQMFVICTANSTMQVQAIADNVREYVETELGTRPFNYDGYRNSEWIVIDYGTIYVHVFLPDTRERYKLEELWNDAAIKLLPNDDD